MQRFIFCFLLLPTVLSSQIASSGEIAITFDDAPRPDTSVYSGVERTETLIDSLKSVDVEAMFFVVGQAINADNLSRLQQYSEAGHTLANHSFSHQSANRVSASDFIADFDQSHHFLSELPSYQRYFRYPYLHKGDVLEKQQAIFQHITNSGYTVGYITVDNFDWYLDNLLQEAIQQGKEVDFEKLQDVYVNVLWQTILFYDHLAVKVLGRSPKHVLLLHENDLAALYVDDLVKHIHANDWQVISPADAYTDKIADYSKADYLGSQGRIAELAKTKGIQGSELRHESEDEDYLRRLFEREGVFK